ncbi:cation:proton antiporter [Nonomuraea sp. NPDC050556]|uniref:cation:proton antiporter n=1 Tax=Nonomuraea sp. NPDC050556 TaxID=3364369 RepID=UPI00379EB8FA
MALTLIAVVGVASLVAVAVFADRIGLAAPLLLVVVGAGLGFIPGMPPIDVEPEWILAGVLPPLLYSSAVSMPATDFRRNFKLITGLAVLLVVVTTLGAGWLIHALLPGVGWPAAFAVGAVISPTDAVAATSVGRRLGLPSRLLTVLEGEGLVNDASALVLLRSATAAMAAAVSIWGVTLEFFYSVVVASAIGLVLGRINVRLRAWLGDPVLGTAVSLVVPFVAYWPAEELKASGVLAVVVTGVVTGSLAPRYLAAADRLSEAINWRTLAFLLEGGIFLSMGLSLRALVDQVEDGHLSVGESVLYGLAATALVIVIRILFTGPLMTMVRRDERRAAGAGPRLEEIQAKLDAGAYDERMPRGKERIQTRLDMVAADVKFKLDQSLGWRGGLVLAWSGMRGAITVAAAQTLPDTTPFRAQLILIAFVVAAATLLLQGSTLPAVIAAVEVPPDDPARLREDYHDLLEELSASGQTALDEYGGEYPAEVVDRVRADSKIGPTPKDVDAFQDLREQYQVLRLKVLHAQRHTLLADRARGTHRSETLDRAQNYLDREELSLQRQIS